MNTTSTPKVQYGYASGSANHIRQTTLIYPNGRVLHYDYGSVGGSEDALSRLASLIDNDGTTHLVDYSYLGRNTFVVTDYPEPDIKWTLIGTAGGNDPDTGDIYRGLDRFDRVKDCYWYNYGTSADVDRIKYGYDRNGNRTYRENVVAAANNAVFDEKYVHDLIDRVKQMDRGRLTALKNAITNKTFAQCWSLDATGNWRKFLEDSNGDSSWDLDQLRSSNRVNEVTDLSEYTGPAWVTPAYNRAGNMTTVPKPADPTQDLAATYDGWNRLVKLEDGSTTVAEYQYDPASRRTAQENYIGGVLNKTLHLFYTDPHSWQVIEERIDSSSTSDRQYLWGVRHVDDLVARFRDTNADGTLDERLYSLQDANWNMLAIGDSVGAVQERYNCMPYGLCAVLTASFASRSTSSFDWETRFGGYRYDSPSGLLYVRARYYHPTAGVWLTRDPLWIHSLLPHLYSYVNARPLTFVDPSGAICAPCALLAIIIGIILFTGCSSSTKVTYPLCGTFTIVPTTGHVTNPRQLGVGEYLPGYKVDFDATKCAAACPGGRVKLVQVKDSPELSAHVDQPDKSKTPPGVTYPGYGESGGEGGDLTVIDVPQGSILGSGVHNVSICAVCVLPNGTESVLGCINFQWFDSYHKSAPKTFTLPDGTPITPEPPEYPWTKVYD